MRADGMMCCSIHIPVVTVGIGDTARSVGGPHTDVVSEETMVVTATRGYENHLGLLSGPELLNDFAEQGEQWKNVHQPPLPSQCLWLRNW